MNRIFAILGALMLGAMLFAAVPQAQAQSQSCYQPSRLSAGQYGRVTTQSWLPNRMRAQPFLGSPVIGTIPAGATFRVQEGPQCNNGMLWWAVNYKGLVGWTAEGDGFNQYWLEPYSPNVPDPTPHPYCTQPPRLSVGQQARITPGLPNVVRTEPGTNASGAVNSRVIGEIPGGGVFTVLNGPQCGTDGRLWWYVDYNGLVGWTAQGEGNEYWVEPVGATGPHCPGFLPSRLVPGNWGAVMVYPYLPNRIRVAPDLDAQRLGLIPPGAVFKVISGPYCNDNTAWYQVSYGATIGWTAEGQGNTYWLEPR